MLLSQVLPSVRGSPGEVCAFGNHLEDLDHSRSQRSAKADAHARGCMPVGEEDAVAEIAVVRDRQHLADVLRSLKRTPSVIKAQRVKSGARA